jgi:hypothetical protein
MSDVTVTAKCAEFALGIIRSLFKCKLKFRGQEVLLLLFQFFAMIQTSINICILIATIKLALSTYNVSLLTSFHTYQQARRIGCSSPNLTLTHVEY